MIDQEKIYKAIQKGLNEALTNLSIDDFDDVETMTTDNLDVREDISKTDTERERMIWKAKIFLNPFRNFKIKPDKDGGTRSIIEFVNTSPKELDGYIKTTNSSIKHLVTFGIKVFGENGNLNWIDTSMVTDMSNLFEETTFNGDISRWDVSNVTNMSCMFAQSNFNGDIFSWDVSNVVDMSLMFAYSEFNSDDISNWDVSNVLNMARMFHGTQFNKDISNWCLNDDVDSDLMFEECTIKDEYKPENYVEETIYYMD